ncbi:histidine kinase [Paraburkholderia phytofirmans OLGA172]|uniref:histidine kinase n=1 Tax=Paraburkholderia phytofirmans OLGA172 TaxID=1417228 RepID=A0A161I3D6_9BURK|nr:histidine kinase [Paraburkholderia phytofirmans OLGA172]
MTLGADSGFEVVWQDGHRVFCRGWADGDHDCMPALFAAEVHATPDDLRRLAHEYGLKDELKDAWAVRPLALVRGAGGQAILILEDPGGEPLERVIGPPMELGRFLQLAIGLSAALGKLHERGFIHRDIKPANVFVNTETGQVWLTGFGIASPLPRERQLPESPETIAGTLAYMAPEQTGRMNRSIDSRSDLYSLGVTLYEMLSGSLPFTASDPTEWVYAHIARPPVPLVEHLPEGAAVPATVTGIVMKLLAKTAEERYQTAAGAEADLRKCLAQWEAHKYIDAFRLGGHDASDQLLIAEKLYGREREREALLNAFDQVVAKGTPILVLVSGYSGVGKSSMVNELHKAVVIPRGIFISGKFDQHKRDVPYATLAQAFQTLIRQILAQHDAEVGRWRDDIRSALGANAQLIVELIPDLEFVVGKQSAVPELPPAEAQTRFHMALRSFVGVFARKEHPLALFLDDLQWLDAATLRLLEELTSHPDARYLLLIGAFRGNEVGPSHPLTHTLDTIRGAGTIVRDIVLTPLSIDDLLELVADTLHCDHAVAMPLARLLHDKTLGNPFFAIQFLNSLCDEHLLSFDAQDARWNWNLASIEARGFSDNVVDLMVEKLKRLRPATLEALKDLACLGTTAGIAALSIAREKTNDEIRKDLWESVRLGLVTHQDESFKFAHDRVWEAAYSLVPVESRPNTHLRIGRKLFSGIGPASIAERIFDVANQLNAGMSLVTEWAEKQQIADLNLRAARKAKASAAHSSACLYLSKAMLILGDQAWTRCNGFAFRIRLERAECEFLSGHFETAEVLIEELLTRCTSLIDKAAVYRIKIDLHVVKSENALAIESGLECLHLFGVDMPMHPTREHVEAEYDNVWKTLGERPIQDLINLPLTSDPQIGAAIRLLSVLFAPSIFTDFNLTCLVLCKMLDISVRRGNTDAAAVGYAWFGVFLGQVFHRYPEGYEFARLAGALVEKYDLTLYRARTYFAMEIASLWTQPIATGLRHLATAIRIGVETGDLTFVCFSRNHVITDLFLRGDLLEEVWQESVLGLEFARAARFRDAADIIVSQQRYILNMQGKTSSFSTFSDAEFDEDTFEAQLDVNRMNTMVCWYWVLKLEARIIFGDNRAAIDARQKAEQLLWSSAGHIQLLNYHFFGALAVAAAWDDEVSPAGQRKWCEMLHVHAAQLREWAEKGSPTFRDKFELVAAEAARIDGHHLEAMRLYESAIRAAHDGGFVHNEGIASEFAGRFYLSFGLETNAYAHLHNALSCFALWGANGKVRHLESCYPRLSVAYAEHAGTTTVSPVQQLDVATVVKASQAVSGEIELPRLIERLMTIALQTAGSDRGLLILPQSDEYPIAAEARAVGDEIVLSQGPLASHAAPESLLRYVAHTQKSVIIDDAAKPNSFSGDEYITHQKPRSVLCLPLVRQGTLGALLYLENTMASHVFTAGRISLLEVLASQAAISLENTRLYSDLQEREARFRRLVEANIIGIFIWNKTDLITDANDAFLRIVDYDRLDLLSGNVRWTELTPEDWRDRDEAALLDLEATGSAQPYEKEYFRKDGTRVPVLIGAAAFDQRRDHGVAFVLDLTERRQAEQENRENERRYREVQTELAHANRVATMGQLSASISHEVRQPITAAVVNADAALRWLSAQPPNLQEVRQALSRISADGKRAADVIGRIHAFFKKAPQRKDPLDINETIIEVIALGRIEAEKHGIDVQLRLVEGLPQIEGDRVQLQQVVLNLMVNGVEAMSGMGEGRRELLISTCNAQSAGVAVAVEDSGNGLDPADLERIFDAFHTTKPDGLGMGLSICRAIIEAHGGRLWATVNRPHGATFRFTLPARESAS